MHDTLRLMCILAHPDDESLGTGGILARYAAEGVATTLVTATRGERGWQGSAAAYPGSLALGRMREAELRAAAQVLGLREVVFLGYQDGELDRADPAEAIGQLVAQLRRLRPDVVVTFDPSGVYGHPDHIAISQFTMAAIVASANPGYAGPPALPAHQVAKLYYLAPSRNLLAAYQKAFGDLVIPVDGPERRVSGWDSWAITTQIDTIAYWPQVWQAVSCHRTQLPAYQMLQSLPDEHHHHLWGTQTFYRAFSLVNGGRTIERDLFEGLRNPTNAAT
ncbi:MAG: PIG-L deacetylase family protein [Kouleothrix sp.]